MEIASYVKSLEAKVRRLEKKNKKLSAELAEKQLIDPNGASILGVHKFPFSEPFELEMVIDEGLDPQFFYKGLVVDLVGKVLSCSKKTAQVKIQIESAIIRS